MFTSDKKQFYFVFPRADTIKSALETLAMCSVMPKTQMVFCESVQLNGEDGGQVQTPSIR